MSKAAAWKVNSAFRVELADQGTQVPGAHAGLIDIDMRAGWDFPKIRVREKTFRFLEAATI